MSNEAKVVKVKVSPYPISVTFGVAPALVRGKIMKLSKRGFLAEVESRHMIVHEKHEAQFTLPVYGTDFKEPVIVVKTYDRMTDTAPGAKPMRLIEFHFIRPVNTETIEKFLREIGQTK